MEKLERDTDRKMAVKFVEEYLRQDGVFVMRLVGHNTNALTVTEFVCQLWDNFRNKPLTERADGTASEVWVEQVAFRSLMFCWRLLSWLH